MKKATMVFLLLALCMAIFAGCSSQPENPGPPPEEVVNPNGSEEETEAEGTDATAAPEDEQEGNDETASRSDVLENAVSVRIGQRDPKNWSVDMYDNAASQTMLNYLSSSGLLFPTYTYDEEQGFVAQSIRGSYSRDDETTVSDVKAGELYLFSGGQLRFYFKDAPDANITATPVGYYADTEGLTEAVQTAYESNKGDMWGVDVYFIISKNIE